MSKKQPAHRLRFSGKTKEKKENYNTVQRSIIGTYAIYKKRTKSLHRR